MHSRAVLRKRAHQRIMRAIKLKEGCRDCGYREHAAALEFDHLPGSDKRFQIGREIGRRLAVLLEEAKKCEVVCANCHQIRGDRRRAAGE